MKKYPLITLLLAILVLAGCVNNTPTNQNTNETLNTNQDTTTTTNEVILTPTTTETIDTSDWLTYRNEEYGFEFKYPNEIADKKFDVYYYNENTKSFRDLILFSVAITPQDLGYQDHMLVFHVVKKNSMNDFSPSWFSPERKRDFKIGDKVLTGYEEISTMEHSNSTFILQWLLIRGKEYDYCISSGFEDVIKLSSVIDNIIFTFQQF
jgi:hypothetical protein